MLGATARQSERPGRAGRAWRGTLAAALACALLFFTTVYRHSSAFSPATAARIHALSADHTDARTLFAGDFGPLAVLVDAPVASIAVHHPSSAPAVPAVAPDRPLALVVTPFHRPPPSSSI
jgi:hypothetical protein